MAVALPTSRAVAFHEACHAAALMLAGMAPHRARIDRPDDTTAGSVTIDWGDGVNRESARAVLIALLVGGTSECTAGWDEWPLDPEAVADFAGRDAEQARHLAVYLKFDAVDWAHVRWQARQLGRQRDFRRLAVAIADELEDREVLEREDLDRIHREVQQCST